MADFSATWSASDRPIFPYNPGTEALIEAPQAPKDRARKGLQHGINNSFCVFAPEGQFSHILVVSLIFAHSLFTR